jgi:hypothetical protein
MPQANETYTLEILQELKNSNCEGLLIKEIATTLELPGSRKEHVARLNDLYCLGWIEKVDKRYLITDEGIVYLTENKKHEHQPAQGTLAPEEKHSEPVRDVKTSGVEPMAPTSQVTSDVKQSANLDPEPRITDTTESKLDEVPTDHEPEVVEPTVTQEVEDKELNIGDYKLPIRLILGGVLFAGSLLYLAYLKSAALIQLLFNR